MPAITPVPSTRVSDVLVRQRLTSQLRFDQLEIYKIQAALASGRRLELPSDDTPAALRGVALQSLLERKQQVRANLETSSSFLANTDTALSQVSNLLTEARGLAVSVAGVTASDAQRAAAAQEIDNILAQLLKIGGQSFRGRYLFAGTTTGLNPLTDDRGYVRFDGNLGSVSSYSDLDVLFATNLSAQDAFGVLSEAVRGTADLDPRLTAATPIADLRGGAGVSLGVIEVSDGTNSAVVDLTGAVTVGDIKELLELPNVLPGRLMSVTISDTGLQIALDALGGGNLTIRNVGAGTTASELGIVQTQAGLGIGPKIGEDLNPRITLTTPLTNLLGIPATATLVSAGGRNDIALEAATRGTALAGVTVTLVAGAAAGSETATYNPVAKTLQITVADGVSTANQVIAAIHREGTFRATLAASESPNDGTGVVQATSTDPLATATTALSLGLTAGLQIRNGNQTHVLDLSAAETVQDLLNVLNGSAAGVLATLNAAGNGIDVRSRLSGADFGLGENGGRLATFLGVRSFTGQTRLDELNHGLGVQAVTGPDFRVTRSDGTWFDVDVSTAPTIQDVIDLINTHPANFPLDDNPTAKVTARLAEFGNGIELVSIDTSGTGQLSIARLSNSQAAADLGLLAPGADASPPPTYDGSVYRITGADSRPIEVDGAFNALIRLRDALRANDEAQIERTSALLADSIEQAAFARAQLGARQQGLDTLALRLDDEELQLTTALSKEIDADLAAVISEFTARQISYEAALRTTAQIFQLTLLNFL